MKTEAAANPVHNNKIYSQEEQVVADYLKKKLEDTLPQPKYSGIIAEYREDAAEPDFDKRAGNLADNIRRLVKADLVQQLSAGLQISRR